MSGFQINHVVISGNLTRDPETRSTSSGVTLCRLGVAVNERYKDSSGEWADRPNYFNVTLWRGVAEWVGSNLHKGDRVVIDGRLRWHQWQADDGSKREAVDITGDSIVTPGGGGGGGYDRDVDIDTADLPDVSHQPAASGGDEDIPFAREPERFEWEPWHAYENRPRRPHE